MDSGTHLLLQAAGFDFIGRSADDSDFLGCPLVASNMEFKRPISLGDVVTLVSQVKSFGNTSFVVAHEFMGDGVPGLVARGSEVRVWAHRESQNLKKILARPMPENIRGLLAVDKVVDVSV